jgi:alpha-beta hydrolase superfamily lysophospholipase
MKDGAEAAKAVACSVLAHGRLETYVAYQAAQHPRCRGYERYTK